MGLLRSEYSFFNMQRPRDDLTKHKEMQNLIKIGGLNYGF